MPAVLKVPRRRWIAEASTVLGSNGPDSVRVEALAKAIGVTKGSFYSHFASRAELLAAVLDEWQRRATDDALARVDALTSDPGARIHLAGMFTFERELHQLDLAIRNWARTDPQVQDRLRSVDEARMAFLRSHFRLLAQDPDEVEARSILAFTFAIGRHLLADDVLDAGGLSRVGHLLGLDP